MAAVSNSGHKSEGVFWKTSHVWREKTCGYTREHEQKQLESCLTLWRSSCQLFSLSPVFVYNNYVPLSFVSQSGILGRVFTAHCSFLLMLGWLLSCPQDWDGAASLFYQSGPLATETSAHSLLFSVWAEFKNAKTSQEHGCVTSLSPLVFWCVCLVWALGLLHSWRLNRSRGVTATLTPLLWLSWSNVSLLKKTNAGQRITWFPACSSCNVLEVKLGLFCSMGHILTYRCHCFVLDRKQSRHLTSGTECGHYLDDPVSLSHPKNKYQKTQYGTIWSEIITVICFCWGLSSGLMHIWIW